MMYRYQKKSHAYSIIVTILLIISLLATGLFIYKYNKSNTDNETLIETNAQLNNDIELTNSKLTQKDNIILSLQEKIARLTAQLNTKTYTLSNPSELAYNNFITFHTSEEEALARMEELSLKVENNEEIYKGLTVEGFDNDDQEFRIFFGNEEANAYAEHHIFKIIDEDEVPLVKKPLSRDELTGNLNPLYIEIFMSCQHVNTIKIIDNLDYEVGKKYSLFESIEYLDNLEYECYEKTENTVKFRDKVLLNEELEPADNVNPEYLYNYVEITKTAEGYEVLIKTSSYLADSLMESELFFEETRNTITF